MSNLYVYLMRSRNKDNKDIPNFKQRVETILEYKENENKIIKRPGRICSREKEGILPFLHESLTIKSQG